MKAYDHIDLLGYKAEDKVTGFKGVISSVNFDLYGCVQAVVVPPHTKGKEKLDGHWFDVGRLKITSTKPVMAQPNFHVGHQAEGKQGAASKPLPSRS